MMSVDFVIEDLRLELAIADCGVNPQSPLSIDDPQSENRQSAIGNPQ